MPGAERYRRAAPDQAHRHGHQPAHHRSRDRSSGPVRTRPTDRRPPRRRRTPHHRPPGSAEISRRRARPGGSGRPPPSAARAPAWLRIAPRGRCCQTWSRPSRRRRGPPRPSRAASETRRPRRCQTRAGPGGTLRPAAHPSVSSKRMASAALPRPHRRRLGQAEHRHGQRRHHQQHAGGQLGPCPLARRSSARTGPGTGADPTAPRRPEPVPRSSATPPQEERTCPFRPTTSLRAARLRAARLRPARSGPGRGGRRRSSGHRTSGARPGRLPIRCAPPSARHACRSGARPPGPRRCRG